MPQAKGQPHPKEPITPDLPRRKWSRRRIGIAGTILLMLLGLVLWQATKPKDAPPAERQQQAMELLEPEHDSPRNRRLARKIALELEESRFHDPDFPGASAYILGMVAFRDGLEADESKREERFALAVEHLKDAERLALNSQYRDEWAYALGCSLHALGSPVEARPYIEEALESSPERRRELTGNLIEIYLELKNPALLPKALMYAEDLLKTLEEQNAEQHEIHLAMLLKAQVLVALNRIAEAHAALPDVDPTQDANLGVRIIQAQTRMALDTPGDTLSARETLSSVLSSSGLSERQARQTHYLLGVCEESLGDIDRAISQYERTSARYPQTHEGVAAALKEARLLQKAGRDEEALSAFEEALTTVSDPNTYHNRWLGIEQFREQVLFAWNEWAERSDFQNAIALARLMPPLFSVIEARELEARAYEKWAEAYESQNAALLVQDPKNYKRHARERWNASGDAYAALADLQQSSPKYADILWTSAEHYLRAFRFQKAQAQLHKFLATGPKERLALAKVHLAYTQLNADDTPEALELLEETTRLQPRDPAAFRASYLMGMTHLERNDVERAQTVWRAILDSQTLGPTAKEWRDSLFALGSTLYHVAAARTAGTNHLEQKLTKTAEPLESLKTSSESNLESWDESIAKLSEYVRRYPGEDHHREAQYLLSRAHQKSAGAYQAKLENAQIANEKQELAKEYHQRLRIASQILKELRAELMREEELSGLGPFHARLLQNTFFDLGDIAFAMHEYDEALLVYSSAINRYPNHVRVLLSYLQMAQCYQQLGKPEEARSTLKQAQILSQRMDNSTFQSTSTSHKSREEWGAWFDWTLQMLGSPQ